VPKARISNVTKNTKFWLRVWGYRGTKHYNNTYLTGNLKALQNKVSVLKVFPLKLQSIA
jgi:hypothetical protein